MQFHCNCRYITCASYKLKNINVYAFKTYTVHLFHDISYVSYNIFLGLFFILQQMYLVVHSVPTFW